MMLNAAPFRQHARTRQPEEKRQKEKIKSA